MRFEIGRAVLACATVLTSAQVSAQDATPSAGTTDVRSATPTAAPTRIGLQDAITLALQREPRMDLAQTEIARAEALVREARAASYPTLNGNAIYTRLDGDRKLGTRVIAGENQLSANLLLSVPLIAPQRWVQTGHAKDNVEIVRRSGDDVRRQVALAVASAYLAVVAQHRAREVAQRAVDNAHAHYDFAHTRFTGGVGNRLDDVRASQEVATSEAQREAALSGLARAQEALGVLLGAEAAVDAQDDVVLPDAPTLDQGLSRAATERSDVVASARRVKAAERVVDDSWTDYMPLLVGLFQPFYQTPASLTQPTTGWQAQLMLSVPLYDGGLRYGQKAEREANVAASRTQQEAIVRQAKSEVRVAFAVLERSDAGLVANTQAAQLAAQALEMATLSYKAGATSNLEVIDAERRARDAETAVVVAEDTARRARLDLLAASGRWP